METPGLAEFLRFRVQVSASLLGSLGYAKLHHWAPLVMGCLPASRATGFLSTHRFSRHAGHTNQAAPGYPGAAQSTEAFIRAAAVRPVVPY